MNRKLALLVATASLAAGIATAVIVAPAADAFDIHNLPSGFAIEYSVDSANPPTCGAYYVVQGYNQTSGHLCTDSPTFQQDLDAFINANCPITVCVPATTTADTAPATDATTTDQTPQASPAATTVPAETDTTTTTPDCDIACLTARIDALEALYAKLSQRVDAIVDANAAAWQTFHDETAAGVSPARAALDARSAGMNAVYELDS